MKNNICIDVNSISKSFSDTPLGIKQFFSKIFSNKKENKNEKKWILDNISFQVEKGSSFFIAGPNGTGKSTLLSLMQKIILPDKGEIKTKGKLIAINELGGGFHPELTGKDNIFVNGKILGNSYQQIKYNFDSIVEFSGISEKINNPLRTYSNGMVARLAFSIIAHTQASIILIDEILAVGDQDFRKKCVSHFEKFKQKGGTIVLVSHDLGILESFCDRGIYIDKNSVSEVMKTNDLIKKYVN